MSNAAAIMILEKEAKRLGVEIKRFRQTVVDYSNMGENNPVKLSKEQIAVAHGLVLNADIRNTGTNIADPGGAFSGFSAAIESDYGTATYLSFDALPLFVSNALYQVRMSNDAWSLHTGNIKARVVTNAPSGYTITITNGFFLLTVASLSSQKC